MQTNCPSSWEFTGRGYLCGLALCQLLSAAMTLICHSRLSSSVSIFSALLPLILEPCVSIPVTSTVLTWSAGNLSAVCCSSLLYWYSRVAVFKKKEDLCLSVHMVGHVHMYKQIDGHFCQSWTLPWDTCTLGFITRFIVHSLSMNTLQLIVPKPTSVRNTVRV